MLDGLKRYRFLRDPEMLALWERTRRVGRAVQAEARKQPPETPTGEVQPAA